MNKTNTTNKPINQRMLMKMLNLSSNSIRHLKETSQLKFKRVGTQDFFDEVSVKRFMDGFNRNDYLTVAECKEILEKHTYYSFGRMYVNNLGLYVTVSALIKENPDIPSEYRLETRNFGNTQYISKKSFNKTLNWMHRLYNKEDSGYVWDGSKKKDPSNRKPNFNKKPDLPNESDTTPSVPLSEMKTQRQIQMESLLERVRNSGVKITNPNDGKKSKGRLRFPQ